MKIKELLNAIRWAKNNPGALMKALDASKDATAPSETAKKPQPPPRIDESAKGE
ncbi:MAG: hypothetical protein MJZ81_09280 [Bacteroidales bacterium]|nr:hypothetical protein [Bacteroidales bacterium]